MRANRVFQLTVTHSGRGPRFLHPDRIDRIEVSSIADSEPILYWELPAREASELLKRLRADLAGTQAEEFLALWEGADADG
jgi:hypothetical protein